ncbi:hypothetical protein BKA65DRAFT_533379 [Rhexocercosporidium sp. MPI-PUGE-AT-0058]|nr:hypothetical protein BKA65DRAFT_533379 [Rhexocercosporidium sp. MPI-PUGE-AT-0058]
MSFGTILWGLLISCFFAAGGFIPISVASSTSDSLTRIPGASVEIIPVTFGDTNLGLLTGATSSESTTLSTKGSIEAGTVPSSNPMVDRMFEASYSLPSPESLNFLSAVVGGSECSAPDAKLSEKGGFNLDNVREVTVLIIRTIDVAVLPEIQMPST